MIGFTLQWEPYGDGLVAHKEPDTGLLDGHVCAAMIKYARQLVGQQQWEASACYIGWGMFAIQLELVNVLDNLRETDHAGV